jgi:hypothetical protein
MTIDPVREMCLLIGEGDNLDVGDAPNTIFELGNNRVVKRGKDDEMRG